MTEWIDRLKSLFSEPTTLGVIFSSGVLGMIVGSANGVIQRKHGGWPGFFSALATGIGIALIVGLGIQDYIKSETFRLCIIGACAVISDDIWAGLKTVGRGMRDDPLGMVARLIDAFRGKPAAPKE